MVCKIIKDENSVLVPDGEYELAYLKYETTRTFGKKIALWFSIVSPEDYAGQELKCFFNVSDYKNPPRENGAFTVSEKRKFARVYVNLFGEGDDPLAIDMDKFKDKIFIAKVGTVSSGSQKENIPDSQRYSVVRELIRLKEIENIDPAFLEADLDSDWRSQTL